MKKVLIVGGGLGGISAAASLACDGYAVEIFEKNPHLGGKLNVLQKEGFSFDLGPSILTMPHLFERLYTRAGRKMADYVDLQALSPHWRNFFEDGTRIDLYAAPGDTVANCPQLTDKDREQLSRFLDYSRKLYEASDRGYLAKGIDTFGGMLKFHGILRACREFDVWSTVAGGVRRHVENPYLRDILNFFIKYVGSSPYHAPAMLNLLPYIQAEFGLWYVRGGLYNLARGLARLLEDLQVTVHCGAEVVEIRRSGRTVTGVRLADGAAADGDIVISNMEVVPAYERILGADTAFLATLRRFEPACSGLVLHLGTDREYPQLGHHSFFFSRDPKTHFKTVFRDKLLPHDPTLYVVAPARTDKTQAPEGCENIKVLPHIPYLQDVPFTPEQYAQLRERVIAKLERMGLENLRDHIIVEDMWTPEDIQQRYYSNRGAIYGVVCDKWKNFGFKAPKHSTLYDNLYFTGGSVNPGSGMPMAVLSGQQVRDMIVARFGGAGS